MIYVKESGVATDTGWVAVAGGLTIPVPATQGGTGQTVYAVGDLLYAATTTTLGKLADVAAGSYLRSGGVSTAPVWSTLILPNAATQYRIPYATATNTWGESANLNFQDDRFALGGNASDARFQYLQTGTPALAGAGLRMYSLRTTLNMPVASVGYGSEVMPTFVEAASGVHAELVGLFVGPLFTNGAATTTLVAGGYFALGAAPAGTTSAAAIYVLQPPTGATYNYAMWIDAGNVRLDGELTVGGINADGSGKAACVKADGNLGTCSDAVGAGGTCTCG
ncbi:MAG: hypothetical protein A2V88_05835 [Elusimicrobia bacterium RBG_16_66_12]|nr:MAG: hypothetical protein A2V88_05835 [Elusimicrobia bacterium RBG_16_66_12]